MSNLDNVINKTKQLMNMASKKTSDIFEFSKLKMDKANKSAELQKNYELLGKMFYLECKSNENDTDNMQEIIDKIESLESEIKKINNNIFAMKNIKTCKKCGNKNNKEALYCSLCGAPLSCDDNINDKKTSADQSQNYSIDIDDTNEPYETTSENSSNYDEDINNKE